MSIKIEFVYTLILHPQIKKVSLKLIDEGKAEGINVISNNEAVAGQIIFHTHIHIIPRKKNDGLKI